MTLFRRVWPLGCLAAFVAIVLLWVRSYWRLDVISSVDADGHTRAVISYRGAAGGAARRPGYDLRGSRGSDRCPECG